MQKHQGKKKKEKVSLLPLLEKAPLRCDIYCHFITWICSTPSNVFVPSCPTCWCICRLYVDESQREGKKKKKCMTSGREKVLARVSMVSSFGPNRIVHFVFHPAPLMRWPSPALYRFVFFFSFLFLSLCLVDPLTHIETTELAPPCVEMVPIMQDVTVVFKWTSGPVQALEGKITYIALTS